MNSRPADQLTIAVAQLNPIVGDVRGNADKIRRAREAARDADLIVFPELFIAGYPPEDLVLKPAFQAACRQAVEDLARESGEGPALLIGTPWHEDGNLYNAVALVEGGRVAALRFKVDLPNYGVFDEKRVFVPSPAAKSCWCRTARPTAAASSPSASTWRSRVWSRRTCRCSTSTRSADRTSSCSKAPRSRSTPTVRSP